MHNLFKLATSKPGKYDLFPTHIPKVLLIGRGIIINDKHEVLVLRRSPTEDFDALKWEIPGGKIDKGETDVMEGTKREILEETGLELETSGVFAISFPTDPNNKRYKEFLLVNIVQICYFDNSEIKVSEEHSEYKWIDVTNYDLSTLAGTTVKILEYYVSHFDQAK